MEVVVRYTAKARMLSFDFLNDETVYGLSAVQVMLLAGMIARADNLGRLPGDPGVLLGYLFQPKAPRHDVMPDALEGLLMELARAERIAWYAVGGTRFVQFSRWQKNQPGIRVHNRKSSFPAPDGPGAIPVTIPGETMCMFDEEPTCDEPVVLKPDVARQQAHEQRAALAFDHESVTAWIAGDDGSGPLRGFEWMRFAQWLHTTGTRHMPTLVALLGECKARRPHQPYAYFKPGTDTREQIEMKLAARAAERAHEAVRAEERAGVKVRAE